MWRRGWLILMAAALSVAGCGSSKGSQQNSPTRRQVADLARKCGESESAVKANINVLLTTAKAPDLDGSYAEAARALYTLVNYAASHHEAAPDCKRLLGALVSVSKHPPKARICFPYQTGRVCFVSPNKT
jgi:hypothetical protein